jgi:MinD-like ATPase involved in chromosome partitioning or flagellar assembly
MTVEYAHDAAGTLQPGTHGAAHPPTTDSPLVAVCGLCGGAGASTLTYLLARWAASHRPTAASRTAVLAVDAGVATAGLSLYAGVQSSRSLAGLASDVRDGSVTGAPFAVAAEALRVLAGGPGTEPDAGRDDVAKVLTDARRAHRLTVVDCGTMATLSQQVAGDLASHVVWVLPATATGVQRSRVVLDAHGPASAAEIVVARQDPAVRKPRTRALAALAASRRAPLVLMPSVSALSAGSSDRALEECSVTLEALLNRLMS